MEQYRQAISEVLKGIKHMIDVALSHTTKIYNGIIIASAEDKWNVQFNGETHALKPYGTIVPAVGMSVKVIIPQNNMSLAYFE